MDTLNLHGLQEYEGLDSSDTLVAILRRNNKGEKLLKLEALRFDLMNARVFYLESENSLNYNLFKEEEVVPLSRSSVAMQAAKHNGYFKHVFESLPLLEEMEGIVQEDSEDLKRYETLVGQVKHLLMDNLYMEKIREAIAETDYSIASAVEYHEDFVSVSME